MFEDLIPADSEAKPSGMFDDLIPSAEPTGMFDDLVPAALSPNQPPKRLAALDASYPVETVGILREPGELAKLDAEQFGVFTQHAERTLDALRKKGTLQSNSYRMRRQEETDTALAMSEEPQFDTASRNPAGLAGQEYFDPKSAEDLTSADPAAARALALQQNWRATAGTKAAPDPMEFGPLTEAYRVKDGRVEIDPYRFRAGIEQAKAAKVLTDEQAALVGKDADMAESAVKERIALLEDAGKDPKAKALLLGGGRGAVALAGAKGGAMIGGRVTPGPAQAKAVGAFVGSVAGAISASVGERAIEERVAKHSETLRSLTASAALEPRIALGGELAAFVVTAPAAIGKLATATRMVAEDSGKKAAAGFVLKQVGKAAAIGAGVDAVVQGGMIATGVQPEYSKEQLGITTAISALLAGHGVKFRNLNNSQVGQILTRGVAREKLSPEDAQVFEQAMRGMNDLAARGKVPEELQQTATQMLSFQRPITTVETTAKLTPAAAPAPGLSGPAGSAPTPVAPSATPTPRTPPQATPARPTATVSGSSSSAPVVIPPGGVVEGAETVVFGAKGSQFPARYVWASTGLTQTSHAGEMMGPNPNYPLENSRDYSSPEERDKQLDTRNNFDPRRHVTDAPDASTGPRMAATIIDEAGNPVRTTLGGNNRGWAIANLPAAKRAELRALENAKAGNFGLAPTNDPDAELQRDLGTFDLRVAGERERLQGIVDNLNPSPGMVQAHAKRAELDAQTVPPALLEGIDMTIPPGDSQAFVRGLISAGHVDRNLAGSLAENPSAAQDYTLRLLANSAFRTPALVERRMDARTEGGALRGMLDAAIPSLLRLRALGDDGHTAADAVTRTFTTALNTGGRSLAEALDVVSRQTEFDPASIVSRVIAQGLQATIVPGAGGPKAKPLAEPTAANARTLFSLIDRTVRNWQVEQSQAGDLLGGRQESVGDAVIRAVTHFVGKGAKSVAATESESETAMELESPSAPSNPPRAPAPTRKPLLVTPPQTPALPKIDPDAPLVYSVNGSPYANVTLANLPNFHAVDMPEVVEFTKALGLEFSIKGMKDALGSFKDGRVTLNPRMFSDPVLAAKVLMHEVGHWIDWFGKTNTLKRGNLWGRLLAIQSFRKERWTPTSRTNDEFRQELIAWSDHWKPIDRVNSPADYIRYRESSVELYADFISGLLTSPATVQQFAPKFFKEFFRQLGAAKPEIEKGLRELQQFLNRPFVSRQKHRIANIHSGFQRGETAFLAAAEESRTARLPGFHRGKWEMMKAWALDHYEPALARATEANTALGDELINMLDAHPWGENMHWRTLQKLDENVVELAGRYGFTMNDIGTELLLQRVANEDMAVSEAVTEKYGIVRGGRANLPNPGAHTPQTARQVLAGMRNAAVDAARSAGLTGTDLQAALANNRERFAALERAVQIFRDTHIEVMRRAFEAQRISPEVWQMVQDNGYYAAFVPLKYVTDYATAQIAQQLGTLDEIANPYLSTVLKMVAFDHASAANRVKLKLVEFLKDSFPHEINPATKVRYANGEVKFKTSGRPGWELLELHEHGVRVAYEVPADVALMFERDNSTMLAMREMPLTLLGKAFRKWIYPVFITFNPEFQLLANPIRDIRAAIGAKARGQSTLATLRQLPLIKHIGPNRQLRAARDLILRRGLTEQGEEARLAALAAGQTGDLTLVRAAEQEIELLKANEKLIAIAEEDLKRAVTAGDVAVAKQLRKQIRDLVKQGTYHNPLIMAMLDNQAIMPGDQAFYTGAGSGGDAWGAMLQRFNLLPQEEATAQWAAVAAHPLTSGLVAAVTGAILGGPAVAVRAAFTVGFRNWVRKVGQLNEALPKITAYDSLAAVPGVTQGPESDLSVHVRNHVGTPNFRKGGYAIKPVGSIQPFIRVWMSAWRSTLKAAGMGRKSSKATLPNGKPNPVYISSSGFWVRWMLLGGGVGALLKVAQSLGVFGEDKKKAMDLVSNFDKANSDVLTLGFTGASDVSAAGKVVALRVPVPPAERLANNILYHIALAAGQESARNGLLGGEMQRLNTFTPSETSISTSALAALDADIPGFNPMLTMLSKWWEMESGGKPRDNFRGSDILSNDAADARSVSKWPARQEMAAWTINSLGGQTFFRQDKDANTWTEAFVGSLPGVASAFKITDTGERQRQFAAADFKKASRAMAKFQIPSEAIQLYGQYNHLEITGAKFRSPTQEAKFKALSKFAEAIQKQVGELTTATITPQVKKELRERAVQLSKEVNGAKPADALKKYLP